MTGAVWAPHLISLVVGTWVDQRPRKKRVLVGANLVQAAAIASLPIAYAVGTLTLVHLCIAALVAGAGGCSTRRRTRPSSCTSSARTST